MECKKRAKLPALVTSALAQAAKDIGTGDNRRPLLVMEEDYGTPIVACYLTDFIAALEQEGPNSAWKIRELCRSIKKLAGQVEELAK